MRAFINLYGYRVAVSESDIDAFNASWPCSNLHGLRGVTFVFEANGDLCDIHYVNGGSDRWDGTAIAALSEDAQRYAESKQAFRNAGTLAYRQTRKDRA